MVRLSGNLRSDPHKERDAITRIWKKREAQLTRMTTGMLPMVGDRHGIGQGRWHSWGRLRLCLLQKKLESAVELVPHVALRD